MSSWSPGGQPCSVCSAQHPEWMHQGPAWVEFDRERDNVDAEGWGVSNTVVTFRQPGDYVLRVRADNFDAADSGFDYQCCWSNAYIPVTVTP